jgi:hypothetical protein
MRPLLWLGLLAAGCGSLSSVEIEAPGVEPPFPGDTATGEALPPCARVTPERLDLVDGQVEGFIAIEAELDCQGPEPLFVEATLDDPRGAFRIVETPPPGTVVPADGLLEVRVGLADPEPGLHEAQLLLDLGSPSAVRAVQLLAEVAAE